MEKTLIFSILMAFCSFSFAQKTQQEMQEMIKAMTSGKKVAIKPEYNFAGSATYTTTFQNNGKTNKGNQKWLFPTGDEMLFGIEIGMVDEKGRVMNNRSIIDYKNKAMIMLMDEQKMAMSMPFDIDKTVNDTNNDPKYKTTPPKKSGRSKTILGYNCEEWVMESEEYSSSIWISDKMPFASMTLYKAMQQQMYKNNKIMLPSDLKGMLMEMQGTSKKDKGNYTMTCTNISSSAVKISTAGYKTM